MVQGVGSNLFSEAVRILYSVQPYAELLRMCKLAVLLICKV